MRGHLFCSDCARRLFGEYLPNYEGPELPCCGCGPWNQTNYGEVVDTEDFSRRAAAKDAKKYLEVIARGVGVASASRAVFPLTCSYGHAGIEAGVWDKP